MLPAAVAVAMAGFIGAFGGSTPAAHAIEGDICAVETDAMHVLDDGQGNEVLAVQHGVTYGLVFHVEDSYGENVAIRIDSETGSARITSQAEILDYEDGWPNVGHILVQPATGSIVVDTIEPDDFNDADGHGLVGINEWLTDVGYTAFAGDGYHYDDEDDDYCGNGVDEDGDDGWGFIDFECIEAGTFHIDISSPDDTEEIGYTLKFLCGGQAESAEISGTKTLETNPVGTNVSETTVVVTVWDQFDDRLEHAEVTFSTDNCTFKSGSDISPAGGGTTVTTYTDSDTTSDDNFLVNNPLQVSAGTAEAVLDCSKGKAGTATVTAIVQRPGSDIVLKQTYTVVGQTSATGLTLTLTPDDLECGETILAVATAVDSLGQKVSDGTPIHFTTDTSSGILGGDEGAQGGVYSVGGEASVLIATDPGNAGTHTVIAYTLNAFGSVNAQTSETYVCDGAVAPAAPTVAPPATGTGTGSITPPNTGDAGLAAGSSSSFSFIVIAGAVAFVLAGVASIRSARN
jgi:hypothetical protein